MYANEKLETASRDRIRSIQEEKLQALLDQVARSNRFYQEKWQKAGVNPRDIRTLDDLRRLPFTTKSELSQNQKDYPLFGTDLTYPLERYIRFHQTSGTTGQPLRWIDTPESWDWFVSAWSYIFTAGGVGPGDRIYFAFSFGPFIGFWAAVEGARLVSALVLPGGGLDSIQRLNAIQDNEATVLLCTPTYALRLAEAGREKGIDTARSTIRTTIHAGEPGASIPATRRRIEEAWGARCLDHAGATEVGAHSFECQENGGGLHIIETEFIAEVLDPQTQEPVKPGERGELVITNLGRIASPVIRYRTGDLVEPNWERCVCGRTF
ncbi:MAG: AMP-binding protein, partial [Candidatus Tectomicrobia bacterium]|nr:AMP-binding protein [Candidatus Tectomicrobia bacterium]